MISSSIHLETIEQEFADKKSRLVYTHRLLPGVNPVEGYGLRLAESLDVPESILKMASSFASQIRNASEVMILSNSETKTKNTSFGVEINLLQQSNALSKLFLFFFHLDVPHLYSR